jgi:hypothetical protein
MCSWEWTRTLADLFFGKLVYRGSYLILSVMLMATCASAQNAACDASGAVSATEPSF